MMVTYPFEFGQLSIQEKALAGNNLQSTDTKAGGIFVFQGIPFIYFGFSCIKNRSIRTPQLRISHCKLLFKQSIIKNTQLVFPGSNHFAVFILDLRHNTVIILISSFRANQRSFQRHFCIFVCHHRSGSIRSPSRNMRIFIDYQMNIAVQSGPRIPT